jgi:uncharacterized protein YhbP (UPF0306 family)
MDLNQRVLQVLNSSHLMSLGVQDDRGPWVSDVIFIFDDENNLYWMSDPKCRHSQAILKNPKVAGTITASNKSKEPNFGIQFEGTAEKIEGARHDLAIKHRTKRGHPVPSEQEDVLDGDSWYVLKPSRIRLIDEENFGFTTQNIPSLT